MRYLITAIIIISTHFVNAQVEDELFKKPLPLNENGKLEFTEVVTLEGSKEVLYLKAREWFVSTYNSAEDVLQMDDRESGKLIGKVISPIYITALGLAIEINMHYTVSVYLKDGRYKYSITGIYYKSISSTNYRSYTYTSYPLNWYSDSNLYKKNGKAKSINKQYKEQTFQSMYSLIENLNESMKAELDDDW